MRPERIVSFLKATARYLTAYVACCVTASILYALVFVFFKVVVQGSGFSDFAEFLQFVIIFMLICALPTVVVTVVLLRLLGRFDFTGYGVGGAICPYIIQLELSGARVRAIPADGILSLQNLSYAPLGVASALVFWLIAIRPSYLQKKQTEHLSGTTE